MSAQTFLFTDGYITSYIFLDIVVLLFIYLVGRNAVRPLKHIAATVRLRAIPGPKSHWLFGHVKTLNYVSDGFEKRLEVASTYPSFYRFDLGPLLSNVILHHPENIKTVLAENPPKGNAYVKILSKYLGSNSLLISHGVTWKRHKSVIDPIFHSQSIKAYSKIFNETTAQLMDWLDDRADSGDHYNITPVYENLTFNNLARTVLSQKPTDEEKTAAMAKANETASWLVTKRFFNVLLWNDVVYNLTSDSKHFHDACDYLQNESLRVIKQRKVRVTRSRSLYGDDLFKDSEKDKKPDILDILKSSRDADGRGLNQQEIIDEIRTFFAAGQETTSRLLCWLTHLLAEHPEHQEKCRQEILEVCGDKEEIEWSDLNKLQYLNMCMKESLRMYPSAPAIARKLSSPTKIRDSYSGKEYELEAGTVVTIFIYVLHRHPDLWEDPHIFDPERFSPERSKGRHPHSYLPFGAMHRICIGKTFALNEVKIAMCHVLRKYHFYRDHSTPKPKMKPGMFLRTDGDNMFVKIKRV